MKCRIILFLIFLGFISGTYAFSGEKQQAVTLESMTVTAQKYEQKINKTPVSMDAFSQKDLEEKRIETLKDLSRYSPNVHVKSYNVANAVVIRGVAPFTTTLSGPAGLFMDGVALPTVFMQQPEIFDVERVEILKGPQGTLYGKNTESGVINIVSKKPGNTISGSVGSEYYLFDKNGNDDPFGFRLNAAVSGPVAKDFFFAGLSAAVNKTDGFHENIFNDDENAGEYHRKDMNVKFTVMPSDALEINFSSMYCDADEGKGKFRFKSGPAATEAYTINYDGPYDQDFRTAVNSLNAEYDFGGVSLHSITGQTMYHRDYVRDIDMTTATGFGRVFFDLDDNAVSEELRVQSSGSRHRWMAGLYLFSQDTDVLFYKENTTEKRDTDLDTDTYAVFGQYTHQFTEKTSMDFGLRYEWTRLDAGMAYTTAAESSLFGDDETFSQLLPKFSLNYTTQNGMAYISAAKGYLAGGVNYNNAKAASTLLYDSEETMHYEAGYKTAFMNNTCHFSTAVFYVDMDDKQVQQSIPGEMSSHTAVENVASAYSFGAEADVKVLITHGMEFFANAGILRSKVVAWEYNGEDYSGNDLPYAPKFTGSTGVSYIHETGFFGRGDVSFTSDFYHDGANDSKEKAYQTTHVSLGYKGEHFMITAWCENLFDERYAESRNVRKDTVSLEDGPPRTIGLKVDYRF